MSADDVRYSPEHLWLRREDGGVTLGITDRISRVLTWVRSVELVPAGAQLAEGDELGVIDSQKAEIAIVAPVPLQVVAANEALGADPMLVRMQPDTAGWLVRVTVTDRDWARLLDAAAYHELLRQAT